MEKNQADLSLKNEKTNLKEDYEAPSFESHKPLEIMSAYTDRSSELPF